MERSAVGGFGHNVYKVNDKVEVSFKSKWRIKNEFLVLLKKKDLTDKEKINLFINYIGRSEKMTRAANVMQDVVRRSESKHNGIPAVRKIESFPDILFMRKRDILSTTNSGHVTEAVIAEISDYIIDNVNLKKFRQTEGPNGVSPASLLRRGSKNQTAST